MYVVPPVLFEIVCPPPSLASRCWRYVVFVQTFNSGLEAFIGILFCFVFYNVCAV